jgi:tRNA(Ile)-lysidine synthase
MQNNGALAVRDKLAASLTRYSMASPGDRIGIAVSGGADSVTLLHLLHDLANYQITVLHVNHQLRGAESDGDEAFVRELSAKLGLEIEVLKSPVGAGNLEQLARDQRRAFFAECRVKHKLRCVALGHNQTDQAETVLYRFMRGSGLAGLAGMLPVTPDGLIRPMLGSTREEIRQFATGQGIVWREDSSNRNTDLVRNRLRLEVFNPQLVRVLSANAAVAQDEEDWWAGRISSLHATMAKDNALGAEFQVGALRDLHPAERRRLIRHAIRKVKGDLRSVDLSHVEAILKLLATEAGHDRVLIPGVDALRSFGTLLLAKPGRVGSAPRHYHLNVKIGEELALPYGGGRLYLNSVKSDDTFCANFGMEAKSIHEVVYLDGDVLRNAGPPDSLRIRNWEPGDEYRRAGHDISEKVKSLFQEFRILLWDRRRWPVLVLSNGAMNGEEIVWSRRFGAAARFRAKGDSRSIVCLCYVAEDGLMPN